MFGCCEEDDFNMLLILFSMNASITIPRQRNTQRSPKSTTGNAPAPDRLVVQTQNDVDAILL